MNKLILNDILVMGMQRSGHHAIINWIYDAFEEPKIFFNHCSPITGKTVNIKNKEGYKNKNKKCQKDLINLIIYNVENFDIRNYEKSEFKLTKERSPYLPGLDEFEIEKQFNILVIRDLWNWIASKIKRGDSNENIISSINRYKCYLQQALRIKKFVPNCFIINFNKWFSSTEYRKKIIDLFGLNISARPYQKVSMTAVASSFNGKSFNGRASAMKVLERYKHFINKKKYIKWFKDEELVSMAEEFFKMKVKL
jgi:hypothetical protein